MRQFSLWTLLVSISFLISESHLGFNATVSLILCFICDYRMSNEFPMCTKLCQLINRSINKSVDQPFLTFQATDDVYWRRRAEVLKMVVFNAVLYQLLVSPKAVSMCRDWLQGYNNITRFYKMALRKRKKKTEKLKSTELSILGRTQLLLFTLQSIKSDSKSFDVVATVSNYKSFNTLAKQCRNAVCLGSKPPCLDMRPL